MQGGPSQGGPSQGGPSQGGPSQTGASPAVPPYAGQSPGGPPQAGPPQAGAYPAAPPYAGPPQGAPPQTGPTPAVPPYAGPAQAGQPYPGAPQTGPTPAVPPYAGQPQGAPPYPGPPQAGPPYAGPPQGGASPAGPPYPGAPPYAGPPQGGGPYAGAPQYGTAQGGPAPWQPQQWAGRQPVAARRSAALRRPRVWVPLLVVLVLLIGVVVWAPWVAPATPGNVRATPTTATSVRVDWDRADGAGHYAVLRDGAKVGELSGDQTTFTDQGLRPGQSYKYSVVASSWLRESPPTPDASVRALAPSPARPASGGVSSNAAVVTWAAPPNSPAPDAYQVLRDGNPVQTLDAKSTTYRDNGLGPATAYRYQVVAKWGENASDPSEAVTVRTATPPLRTARLTATDHDVHLSITGVSQITNVSRGTTWTESWDLTPRCRTGSCDVVLRGEFSPPGFKPGAFTAVLARHGTLYVGSATAQLSDCGGIDATDTLTIRLTVRTARADGVNWVASSWAGTVTVSSPFVDAGGGSFCAAGRIDSAVAG